MSISEVDVIPLAIGVELSDDELTVTLSDGRRVTVPLVWFPRLLNATTEERREFRLIGAGEGIHWPRVDEDISVASLLRGSRSLQRAATTEYRQSEHGGTWHWCPTCSSYPLANYFVRRSATSARSKCASKPFDRYS